MVEELFEVFEDLFEFRKKKKKKPAHYDERSYKHERGHHASPPVTPAPKAAPVFCLDCGARNEGNSRFCLECGGVLPAAGEEMRCLKCESVVPLTAKFCGRCGARVVLS